MKSLLYGLAALPLLAGVALAQQPVQLTTQQMDTVTAGFDFTELDITNTSLTAISAYEVHNGIVCPTCYLLINNNALSVASIILGGLPVH